MKATTLKLRRFVLLTALSVGLATCVRQEELSECLGSCTVVTGRLLTSGSVALPDALVTLQWVRFVGLKGVVHRKAVGRTDANGHYRVSGFLTDDELTDGLLEVVFQPSKSNYYLIGEQNFAFFNFKRDTLLTAPDYLIPRKAFAKLVVTNSTQIPGLGAYISDFNSCYGRNTTFSQSIRGGGSVIDWFGLPSQNPLEMPGDQPILVRHFKNTNNGRPSATDTIFIPAGATRTYTVTY
ncbi:hypothetical protein [Hymenobacter sp. B1770]|uniref:hypothetical protein n=1 Tax=Hymenobacter sp. B1770 TaxID=1718788 RepID=UPI003CECD0E0